MEDPSLGLPQYGQEVKKKSSELIDDMSCFKDMVDVPDKKKP